MLRRIFNKSCVSILALGVVVSAMPAYAGFEWVPSGAGATNPPTVSGAYVSAPSVVSMTPSVATSMPEVVSPVVVSGVSRPSSIGAVPVAGRDRVDLATATIGVGAPITDDVVQGFAAQIPLVLALRQVLPAGYGFSLDQGVDMDALVSYKGGKSWRETLGAMLGSVGLVSHEQGMSVAISNASSVGLSAGSAHSAVAAKSASDALPVVLQPTMSDVNVPVVDARGSLVVPSPLGVAPPGVDGGDSGWAVMRGDTVRKALTEWCLRAGVELQWLAEYDYPVEASAHFSGGFEDALRGLLAGFESAHPQPIAELHSNPGAGQGVLVVQTRGNTYSN